MQKIGEETGTNVIGCGFDTIKRVAFFTLNGKVLFVTKIEWDERASISALIGLREYHDILINYGDSPFEFDITQNTKFDKKECCIC